MRGMRESLTRPATGMLHVAVDIKSEKAVHFVWKARPGYRIGVNVEEPSRGGWPPLQRLTSQALPEDQTNRRTDPGRMIAYAKPQTTIYPKSVAELVIKATKEISSWRRV
jgi:hypothetical protein